MRFCITIVALLFTVIASPIARVDHDRLELEAVEENPSQRDIIPFVNTEKTNRPPVPGAVRPRIFV
ncbi:hypothetical protein BT96DRAFT_925961 [Gymnopus androsaceus JB14]|uniref:Uncharacterized protein n=1 Tax=Gymnopus androsaceus JB14 TaxID=1447944 RepID=A0A6A4GWX2_9AGAR|nr:hypothetical protein BT96DRAFT_925961 [Gymnopus androsaceus JB14]